MIPHINRYEDFIVTFQMSPNRLAPDRVWVVPGEEVLSLPETTGYQPLMLGYDHGVYFGLHHDLPAIYAYTIDDFTPGIALRIASRQYWEETFGINWWHRRPLLEIALALRDAAVEGGVFGYMGAWRASWPYAAVEERAHSIDLNRLKRWPNYDEPIELFPIGYNDFIDANIPEIRHIIRPFLTRPGLAMVFAERGVGKTLFVSNIAFAAATGGQFLGWKAERSFRVLVLDGEMPAVELQKRYRAIEQITGLRPNPENLVFLTADMHTNGLPDLGTVEGQEELEQFLEGFDLIIIDNLSTLCRTGAENEADSWGTMQRWAVKQRSLGRSVLLVHHAGKNGAQRGTSRREDVLGTVIQLKHPSGYTPTEGANFEIHFTKARGFFGLDAEPIEAQLGLEGEWTWKRLNEARAEDAVALYKSGKTMREVAMELGISTSSVSNFVRAAGIAKKPGRPPKN